MRSITVDSAASAVQALGYFNGFHDARLAGMSFHSPNLLSEGVGYDVLPQYDATLTFVHDNYPAAAEDGVLGHRVEMKLERLTRIEVRDFVPLDPDIQSCMIEVGVDGVIQVRVDDVVMLASHSLLIVEVPAPDSPPSP